MSPEETDMSRVYMCLPRIYTVPRIGLELEDSQVHLTSQLLTPGLIALVKVPQLALHGLPQ